jgi:hypothetical protein
MINLITAVKRFIQQLLFEKTREKSGKHSTYYDTKLNCCRKNTYSTGIMLEKQEKKVLSTLAYHDTQLYY